MKPAPVLAFPAMTASQDGLFHQAVALAPAALLRSLAGAADRYPEVLIHLSGGQTLGGALIRTEQDVVVLANMGTGQLGYALLANVVAVEVHNPERFRDVLTNGRLARPVTGEPVTKLALRREFTPSAEFPVDLDWEALPDSAPALANLDRLLRGLREVAGEVCADELGRQAWARVRMIMVLHRLGERPSVQLVGDMLTLRADLNAALPHDLTGELRRQLNALL
jgi:hypothetical protein